MRNILLILVCAIIVIVAIVLQPRCSRRAASYAPESATTAWQIINDEGHAVAVQLLELKDATSHVRVKRTLAGEWKVCEEE